MWWRAINNSALYSIFVKVETWAGHELLLVPDIHFGAHLTEQKPTEHKYHIVYQKALAHFISFQRRNISVSLYVKLSQQHLWHYVIYNKKNNMSHFSWSKNLSCTIEVNPEYSCRLKLKHVKKKKERDQAASKCTLNLSELLLLVSRQSQMHHE